MSKLQQLLKFIVAYFDQCWVLVWFIGRTKYLVVVFIFCCAIKGSQWILCVLFDTCFNLACLWATVYKRKERKKEKVGKKWRKTKQGLSLSMLLNQPQWTKLPFYYIRYPCFNKWASPTLFLFQATQCKQNMGLRMWLNAKHLEPQTRSWTFCDMYWKLEMDWSIFTPFPKCSQRAYRCFFGSGTLDWIRTTE